MIFMFWLVIGFGIMYIWESEYNWAPIFNPFWVYNNYKVNWFGCIMLTILINLLCPPISIIYWFYKLCTVGRK